MEDIDVTALERLDKEGTAAETEAFLHDCDRKLQVMRRQVDGIKLRAHAILERKQNEERFALMRKRPTDFPAAQKIGGDGRGQ